MRIFVGNIDFATTEPELGQLFASYGVVRSVQIMQDRETGRPRGFGFVDMPKRHRSPRGDRRAPGGEPRGTDVDGQ